jgi:peptidoglycan/LPS O-acetylase OafA/YrhL
MDEKKSSLIPGVLFIVLGLWLFARRFPFLEHHSFQIYPVLLVLFAGFLLYEMSRRRNTSALFWGVVVLVVGAFFFLRNYGVVSYYYADEYWPVFIFALGLGFLALFIYRPRDWGVLIPAGIFLFFGGILCIRLFHGYFWHWEDIIEQYWPVLLIVIGIGVLAGGLLRPSNSDAK